MALNPQQTFEIMARAFRIMTGHTAPGKDVWGSMEAPREEREHHYRMWLKQNETVIGAMLTATEAVIL